MIAWTNSPVEVNDHRLVFIREHSTRGLYERKAVDRQRRRQRQHACVRRCVGSAIEKMKDCLTMTSIVN